jgi:hypothetical protein
LLAGFRAHRLARAWTSRSSARFNVENVLDADYWAGGTGATALFLGAQRALLYLLLSAAA